MNAMENNEKSPQSDIAAGDAHACREGVSEWLAQNAQKLQRVDRVVPVLRRTGAALGLIGNQPRVRQDPAAMAILAEMVLAQGVEDFVGCIDRLGARLLPAERRTAPQNSASPPRPKTRRTVIRL